MDSRRPYALRAWVVDRELDRAPLRSGTAHIAGSAKLSRSPDSTASSRGPNVAPSVAGRGVEFQVVSKRELAVLGHVANGLTNKQIAGRLGISERTVRNHLTHVFSKLQATNRTEAVIKLVHEGVLKV